MTEMLSNLDNPPPVPGECTFDGYVRLYHPFMALSACETSMLIIHEMAHLELTVRTSFGMFQVLLQYLLHNERIPKTVKRPYMSALRHTIEHCKVFHEAYACSCELIRSSMMGKDFHESTACTIPPKEWMKVKPFQSFFDKAIVHYVLDDVYTKAIATTIMNTSILEDFRDYSRLLNVNWKHYFESKENSPDSRFNIFALKVAESNLPQSISQAILNYLSSLSGEVSIPDLLKRYSNWSSKKQRIKELYQARLVAIREFRRSLGIDVMGEKRRIKAYNALFNSWKQYLSEKGIHIGKGPLFDKKPYLMDIDFSLNRILYQPRPQALFSKHNAIPVSTNEYKEFCKELADLNSITYVHINCGPEAVKFNDKNEHHSPQGQVFFLYFQECVKVNVELKFRCIKDNHIIGRKAKSCVMNMGENQILSILRELSHIECVFSFDETSYNNMRRLSLFPEIRKLVKRPIVIYPDRSNLGHMKQILNQVKRRGKTYTYHHQLSMQPHRALDLCILVPSEGEIAYIRPILHPVFRRLIEKEPKVERIDRWSDFNRFFGDSWVGRLNICGMHYYKYGY
ncbi:MAG: hypothetical protein R3F48_00100 [Candidatus Zixiibacteriota bacterium]